MQNNKNHHNRLSNNATALMRLTNRVSWTKGKNNTINNNKSNQQLATYSIPDLIKVSFALTFSVCSANVYAQPLIYDGSGATGTAQLESENSIDSGLPIWMNVVSGDTGLVYRDSGTTNTVQNSADLIIDYSTGLSPKFIIGGYSEVAGVTVSNNTVTITQGSVNGSIYGGLSHNTRINSDVTGPVSGNDTSANTFINFTAQTNVNKNTVNINNNISVTGDIYAANATAWIQPGNAIAGGNANFDSSANATAFTDSTAVTANENTITTSDNISITGNIYGGTANLVIKASNATASDITFTSNSILNAASNAYVSTSNSAVNANRNKINVGEHSIITQNIYGAYANIVAQATGGAIGGNVRATGTVGTLYSDAVANIDGYNLTANANQNNITIGNGSTIIQNIYGGYANLSAQTGNAIAGSAIASPTSAVSMAFASAHTYITATNSILNANENKITIGDGNTVNQDIYGGYANLTTLAGNATAVNAGSTTQVTNANAKANAYVQANASIVSADQNQIAIGENSTVTQNIYGGYANFVAHAGTATAGNAAAIINTNAQAYAYAGIYASNLAISASDNNVAINASTTTVSNVYGGYAQFEALAGQANGGTANGMTIDADASINAQNNNVLANNNTITLNGTLQSGASIYGGYTRFDIRQGTAINADSSFGDTDVTLTNSRVKATNNIVNIADAAQINSTTSSLYGGYLAYNTGFSPDRYDVFTDNTLNFSALPITVNKIANFAHYNFIIEPSLANTPTALITANDIELDANASNISNSSNALSQMAVVGIHAGNSLNADDEFILMQATNSISGNNNDMTSTNVVQQGISLLYDVQTTVDITNKIVIAKILGNTTINPQLKALSEGYLAGAMLVTRGADLVANDLFAVINEQNQHSGLTPFITFSGQRNRYNSGSHIKSNDFLLTGGLSYQYNNLTAAILAESGWGNYDSYNSFYNAVNVHGDGNDHYYGLGVLGRYDFINGIYTEASLRMGKNTNRFDSNDIQNFASREFASYKIKSDYVSAHLGAGYILPINEQNNLDLSAKYLWTTLSGKHVTVAGDNIDFNRVNSKRVLFNGGLNHQYHETLLLKASLGYEYEFDGKAKAIATALSTHDIDAPSVKGSTVTLSLSAATLLINNKNLSLDIKTSGYVGKREGVSATLKISYGF